MKTIDKISIKKLKGQKMSDQELKLIVGGGSNYTSCCGSGCEAKMEGGTWLGCVSGGSSSHCCYG